MFILNNLLFQVRPYLLGALQLLYLLLQELRSYSAISIGHLIGILLQFVSGQEDILRIYSLFILGLFQPEVVAYQAEILCLEDRDMNTLNSGTFSTMQILKFLNSMCFSSLNSAKIATDMIDYLSSVLDGSYNEIEQELAALIISNILS